MKQKKNELWKLDLLEVKYCRASPRFPNTKKLLNAKKNAQLLKKLPTNQHDANREIQALKSDLFHKKFHGSHKKLHREVQKKVKQDLRTWKDNSLAGFFENDKYVDDLITSKLVKLVSSAILTTKELKMSPPEYISEDIRALINDKSSRKNPSGFFIAYCQNDKTLNGYISKLWNAKEIKALLGEIDWSLRKIRGNLSDAEKNARAKITGKKINVENENNSDSDHEDEDGDDFTAYDKMVAAGSDEESESEDQAQDEDSDFFEGEKKETQIAKEESTKEAKHKLPQLATGYFSGSDDEDIDNDKVVKEATTTRKNRRGQRARQKIWEQKYGSGANHVKKERDRMASEREQKQREFEERQRRRELKAQMAESEPQPLAEMHPSWVAKKKAEEKLQNVKFEGKKIKFD